VELLIALLGAALLLSALVLLAGYRRRSQDPLEFPQAEVAGRQTGRPLDAHGSPSSNNWMFGGGGGLG
jgi:hypothetical protein